VAQSETTASLVWFLWLLGVLPVIALSGFLKKLWRTFVPRLTLALPLLNAFLLISLHAQVPSDPLGLNDRRLTADMLRDYNTAPNTAVVIFKVFGERKGHLLDRQAVLKLTNPVTQFSTWQTTSRDPAGENLETGSEAVFIDVPLGVYDAEITAVGFLSAHQPVRISTSLAQERFEVILQRDPSAVNLDVTDGAVSPKTRKELKRAVSALKSHSLPEAEKHLNKAHESSPNSSNINFLLGYLFFEKRDYAQAEKYLASASTLNPNNAQALTLLGRTGMERQDYPAARSALEQAVLADPENWLPHDLLADTYLHEKNYESAMVEANKAVTKGQAAASPAQLVLGQALLNLGQFHDGAQALKIFLDQSPHNPVAGQVRDLVTRFENMPATTKLAEADPDAKVKFTSVNALDAVAAPRLAVTGWQPPGVDDVKLSLAQGVECPAGQVIYESGKRVEELVDDVARFAAIENLTHQTLDEVGNPIGTESRKYDYVASIAETEPGFLSVNEYRSSVTKFYDFPGGIASTGFSSLALVFHPHVRDNFELRCEGLGDWNGQATWLIHFRQRDDRPNRMHSYDIGGQIYPVKLKGRAWITPDKFQIVQIEAEMVRPMPEILLLSEHQIVDYGPVPFPQRQVSLWLPKSAEIYFDFRKHRYHRRHSFDHYMLYSVDSVEKRKEPVAAPSD
jgi:tetratricopeptide (TPR) repeat protein